MSTISTNPEITPAANPEIAPAAIPEITPDDLLKMPDGERYELVDGQLVERNMSLRSSYIGARLSRLIGNFCEEHPLGWVLGADCGYQCFADKPKLVRRPDVSFIRLGRLPGEQLSQGLVRIAPTWRSKSSRPTTMIMRPTSRSRSISAPGSASSGS